MSLVIQRLIREVAPLYRGEAFVQQFDRQQRVLERRALRAELPKVMGPRWNQRSYDLAAMRSFAKDTRFSEAARRGAAFLASPEGYLTLERMQSRSGRPGDAVFNVKDLEAENSAGLKQRSDLVKNRHQVAASQLEGTTRSLVDNFNRAVTASMQQHILRPPSTRID